MRIYLDTSSLIKLYHTEKGTEELDEILENNIISEIYLSDLEKIEFTSAILKKVRTKHLTENESIDVINSFVVDYTNYFFIEIDEQLILTARDLVVKHGVKGLRTLDSIQLASVLTIRNQVDIAFSADDLLRNLFQIEGIKTLT